MGRVFDFVANSQDGVFAVDRRQSIVLWNESATAILGLKPDEVLGQPCYGLIRGRDANGCAVCRHGCNAISAAEKLDRPPTQELLVRTKAGDAVWLDLSTIVVPSRSGRLSVLVHMFRERTRDHDLLEMVNEFSEAVSGLAAAPGPPPSLRPTDAPVDLTRREREIIGLLAMGQSTEKIATRLCISPRTVRNHVSNVLGKLGVHSRLEAVTYSIRNGLV